MKIRIDDIPQNISIKEIVLDIQVNDNSFKVQSTTFANSENSANTANTENVASVAKIVSKSASVSDIKDEGVLNQNEHDLIQKSIIFDDTVVKKIMTPIDNVVFARKGESLEAIKAMFEENNYSRVPYFDDDTDDE